MITVTIPEGMRVSLLDDSQIYRYRIWLGSRKDIGKWHVIREDSTEEVMRCIPEEWIDEA